MLIGGDQPREGIQ